MRDPASISNAVSEGEKITLKEAIICIKWLQEECDKWIDMHNALRIEVTAALMADVKRLMIDQ